MTKPITSLAFMMLVEEGRVAVDTPVADVLPEFRDTGVYEAGGAGVPFQTRPVAWPMRMLDLLRTMVEAVRLLTLASPTTPWMDVRRNPAPGAR